MCTVTLLAADSGFLLTMNRDERRERDEAGLKQTSQGGLQLSYPIDKSSGGTWVGMNNQGVALALLNNYQAPSSDHAISRGEIIPNTLEHGDWHAALNYLKNLKATQYNPFDCLLVSAEAAYQFSWNREHYRHQRLDYRQGLMFSSSSERLGAVLAYREQQFKSWQENDSNPKNIDCFHLQQQPDTARSDVLMSRELTHTKSLVQIHCKPENMQLDYYDQNALKANSQLSQLPTSQSCTLMRNEKTTTCETV